MNPNPSSSSAKVAVIIPCYRVKDHIVGVVRSLPDYVEVIVAVDDCCPQHSGQHLLESVRDPRLQVIFNQTNVGVGGATMVGYAAALEVGADILVKMDGDGQMEPAFLPRLLHPILKGQADFTKGNRFFDLRALRQMPAIRRIGNLGLTLLTKVSSGYWNISDPTNGYTAIHASVARLLNPERIARRYFFETSILIQLNIIRAVVFDVPIAARYGCESSSLSITRAFLGFPPQLLAGFCQRLLWRYFIFNINVVTIMIVAGLSATLFGVVFGGYRWWISETGGQPQSAGTVALALLPTLLGFQMLLQSVLLDIMDHAIRPIHLLVDDTHPLRPDA